MELQWSPDLRALPEEALMPLGFTDHELNDNSKAAHVARNVGWLLKEALHCQLPQHVLALPQHVPPSVHVLALLHSLSRSVQCSSIR